MPAARVPFQRGKKESQLQQPDIGSDNYKERMTQETYDLGRQQQQALEGTTQFVPEGYRQAATELQRGGDAALKQVAQQQARGLSLAMGQAGTMAQGGAQSAYIQDAAQRAAAEGAGVQAQLGQRMAGLREREGMALSQDARDVIQSRINVQEYINSIATYPEQERARALETIKLTEGLFDRWGRDSTKALPQLHQLLSLATSPAERAYLQGEIDRLEGLKGVEDWRNEQGREGKTPF